MPIDPRKRQKKLERRKAKQKAERRELARRDAGGLPARFARAAAAPILHCCRTAELWNAGIGQVLVSRQLSGGDVAFVALLVDVYCLGVKDVIMNVAPRGTYEARMYDKLRDKYALVHLKPECARNLVEGAVQYALDLGLPPHPDYRTAKLIFGDIDAGACDEKYTYGKNGKPFFVGGPYDTPEKCRRILHTLNERCGPKGHHYLIPIGGETLIREITEE